MQLVILQPAFILPLNTYNDTENSISTHDKEFICVTSKLGQNKKTKKKTNTNAKQPNRLEFFRGQKFPDLPSSKPSFQPCLFLHLEKWI